MKSLAVLLLTLLATFATTNPPHAGYPDGMNTYAAYHVMHSGVDPSGEFITYLTDPLSEQFEGTILEKPAKWSAAAGRAADISRRITDQAISNFRNVADGFEEDGVTGAAGAVFENTINSSPVTAQLSSCVKDVSAELDRGNGIVESVLVTAARNDVGGIGWTWGLYEGIDGEVHGGVSDGYVYTEDQQRDILAGKAFEVVTGATGARQFTRHNGPLKPSLIDDCPKKIPNSELIGPPAKRGKAPIGKDGHPVELHHREQKPNSPLDEMTRTDHRGKGNFKKNHENTGQDPSEINRKEWNKQRGNYWKDEYDSGRFDE